ncbi:glycosyltransferase (activator-dependent family) [Nocardiopsis mwathae]|uniref:Glycosyltransferase (Activator-dependent family) n=1 Tax=Nocardiopsis mwathae TaxID=1472723 RepID=A0A7X0D796_9ACTN|nr:activator-dependent family glycosyltransferase [Nocardiopsis mwathae]MBB6174213.1 glycosyltransferase (activator-dependent family) [Nocardiopsis mwathae]
MRVLLTSFAMQSHYFNLVPLAWALTAAGHEVRVAGQPSLTDAVLHSGMTPVPVGRDHAITDIREHIMSRTGKAAVQAPRLPDDMETPLTWDDAIGFETVATSLVLALINNDATVDDLVEFTRSWQPDLVLWEHLFYAGGIAAHAAGVPHARVLWSLDVQASGRRQFLALRDRQPPAHREDPLAEWLTWTLDRFDTPYSEDVATGNWTIDATMPSSMRLPVDQHTIGVRYVPYNGPAQVPAWVDEPVDRPRVCLTLGLTAREGLGGNAVSVADLVHALADLDIELIATLDAEQVEEVGTVPDNTRVVDFVPLHALMPTCSAIIHHGGAGAFGAALVNGVPQLMVADQWDMPVKARKFAETGAGIFIHPDDLTADAVRDGVIAMLNRPSYAQQADRLRREKESEPTPAELVPELERLTAKFRGQVAARTLV